MRKSRHGPRRFAFERTTFSTVETRPLHVLRNTGGLSVFESVGRSPSLPGYAVSTAKSISMARVTMSKNTCRVFGRMPLRSGRKACVAAYIVR